MKTLFVVLSVFSVSAQAHESLAPHAHPHGWSILPGIDVLACAVLALAAVLIAYWKFVRTR